MKKYWILSSVFVVIIGTTVLLVFNQDKKTGESTRIASRGGEIQAAPVANKVDQNDGENEKDIEDIKRMFKPEWERVNQIADNRFSELLSQAQKEYKAKKENNLDVSRLEAKYRNIYNDYEQDTKTLIDNIISNMQKEVIARDLNNNISDEYFELYRIEKEKRIEKVVNELKKLS